MNSFCCKSQDHFDVLATSCFFGGILLTAVLDSLVWVLQKLDCGCSMSQLREVRQRMRRREKERERVGDEEGGRGSGNSRKRKGEKVQLRAVNPEESGRSMSTMPTASRLDKGSEVTMETGQGTPEDEESVLQSQTPGV